MKNKKHIILLAIEVTTLLIVYIFGCDGGNLLLSVLKFPFEQIGSGLRAMSLGNNLGNIFAFIIYVVLCILPCIVPCKKKFYLEDFLRPVLSINLFFVLYQMINTGDNPIFKAILGGSVYSILISYLIFKLLRKIGKSNKIHLYFSVLLILTNMIFVAVIFQNIGTEVIAPLNNMEIANSGNSDLFTLNTVFTILKFIANNISYVFDIVIIFLIIDLINYFKIEKYSTECVNTAKKLSKICIVSLVVSLSAVIGLNLLQIMMYKSLFDVNISVNIPVLSIIFVFACLIFTKIIEENKELTEDKNSII